MHAVEVRSVYSDIKHPPNIRSFFLQQVRLLRALSSMRCDVPQACFTTADFCVPQRRHRYTDGTPENNNDALDEVP